MVVGMWGPRGLIPHQPSIARPNMLGMSVVSKVGFVRKTVGCPGFPGSLQFLGWGDGGLPGFHILPSNVQFDCTWAKDLEGVSG